MRTLRDIIFPEAAGGFDLGYAAYVGGSSVRINADTGEAITNPNTGEPITDPFTGRKDNDDIRPWPTYPAIGCKPELPPDLEISHLMLASAISAASLTAATEPDIELEEEVVVVAPKSEISDTASDTGGSVYIGTVVHDGITYNQFADIGGSVYEFPAHPSALTSWSPDAPTSPATQTPSASPPRSGLPAAPREVPRAAPPITPPTGYDLARNGLPEELVAGTEAIRPVDKVLEAAQQFVLKTIASSNPAGAAMTLEDFLTGGALSKVQHDLLSAIGGPTMPDALALLAAAEGLGGLSVTLPPLPAGPTSHPSLASRVQSYANYGQADLEVSYALRGARDPAFMKGNRMESGIAEMIEKNPQMNNDILHLGGPNRPDFIPRTADGLDYDFIHNENLDVFPLNQRAIDRHFYGRPYGFTMKGVFYLNPPGWTVNPANTARLRAYVR